MIINGAMLRAYVSMFLMIHASFTWAETLFLRIGEVYTSLTPYYNLTFHKPLNKQRMLKSA